MSYTSKLFTSKDNDTPVFILHKLHIVLSMIFGLFNLCILNCAKIYPLFICDQKFWNLQVSQLYQHESLIIQPVTHFPMFQFHTDFLCLNFPPLQVNSHSLLVAFSIFFQPCYYLYISSHFSLYFCAFIFCSLCFISHPRRLFISVWRSNLNGFQRL